MQKLTVCSLVTEAVKKYSGNTSLSFVGKEGMTYAVLADKIGNTSDLLLHAGIQKKDKVAIIGENMPNWGIAYLSILFSGGITVPILPDFHPSEVMSIIDHSESKLVFISLKQYSRLKNELEEKKIPFIIMENLTASESLNLTGPAPQKLSLDEKSQGVAEEDLASIIYTSGTTGSSKGVMLSHKNLSWMAIQTLTIQNVNEFDRFLSILPLSHTYENSLGFLLALNAGASIYYLDKLPTPTVLVNALKMVKPTTILSVPLIIEKIYRKQVLPKLTGNSVSRKLFGFRPTRIILNRIAGKKLMETFGGQVRFFGIGGSKLDPTIEKYLREARFPYAIGYGLTETSPLLAVALPRIHAGNRQARPSKALS